MPRDTDNWSHGQNEACILKDCVKLDTNEDHERCRDLRAEASSLVSQK